MPGQPVLRPGRLGGVALRNALGLGPINPGFSVLADEFLEETAAFFRSYALGGLGLVYLGGVAVGPDCRSNAHSLVMTDAVTRTLVARVAEDLAGYETAFAVQLMHCGRQASSVETGAPLVAASPLPCEYYREVPAQVSKAEIRAIARRFGDSAVAAREAGAAIVEVHAAHGYLVSGFLSRGANRRDDEYGGTLENRFRFLGEILREIRTRCDVAVGVRVNVYEQGAHGITVSEVVDGIGRFRELADFVSVSAGVYSPVGDVIIPPRSYGVAPWRAAARRIRHELGVPVLLAGNISTMDLADEIVAGGDADVVLMVRSLLADPELLLKWERGRAATTQPCTEFYLCKYHSRGAGSVYCPHNRVLRSRPLLPRVRPRG